MARMKLIVLALAMLTSFPDVATAEVVKLKMIEQAPVSMAPGSAPSVRTVRIVGRVYFEVDPSLPANRFISDVDLAPRNARGRVEFSSNLQMLRPLDPWRGNGSVLFEVSNRGRRGSPGHVQPRAGLAQSANRGGLRRPVPHGAGVHPGLGGVAGRCRRPPGVRLHDGQAGHAREPSSAALSRADRDAGRQAGSRLGALGLRARPEDPQLPPGGPSHTGPTRQ